MSTTSDNRLLDALSATSRESILSQAKQIDLPVRAALYWPDEMPRYAFFLTGGIASILAALNDGGSTEVGMIGNEGLVGAFHLIGPISPVTECFMQVPGSAYRIPLPAMREIFQKNEEVRGRILEFVQEQNLAVSQMVVCNKLHEAQARLARWLLTIEDRIDSGTLHITQEFVSQMIGTRRTTVSLILTSMERQGLLRHQRGRIVIADRKILETAACDCYPIIRKSLSRLYSQNPGGNQNGFTTEHRRD